MGGAGQRKNTVSENKRIRSEWRGGGGKIKAKALLTLTIMRNVEEVAKGDIMTLLPANQPLPFTASVTLRGIQGGTLLTNPKVSHQHISLFLQIHIINNLCCTYTCANLKETSTMIRDLLFILIL